MKLTDRCKQYKQDTIIWCLIAEEISQDVLVTYFEINAKNYYKILTVHNVM